MQNAAARGIGRNPGATTAAHPPHPIPPGRPIEVTGSPFYSGTQALATLLPGLLSLPKWPAPIERENFAAWRQKGPGVCGGGLLYVRVWLDRMLLWRRLVRYRAHLKKLHVF